MDSNPQPADYKSAALPIELHRQMVHLEFLSTLWQQTLPQHITKNVKYTRISPFWWCGISWQAKRASSLTNPNNFLLLSFFAPRANHRVCVVQTLPQHITKNVKSTRISPFWWCLGAESNHRQADFQSAALPTELPRHFWRPKTGSNRRPPA